MEDAVAPFCEYSSQSKSYKVCLTKLFDIDNIDMKIIKNDSPKTKELTWTH